MFRTVRVWKLTFRGVGRDCQVPLARAQKTNGERTQIGRTLSRVSARGYFIYAVRMSTPTTVLYIQ